MVGGVKAAECENGFFVKSEDGTQYACATSFKNAVKEAKENETIVMMKEEFTPNDAITITKNITIDLNGNTLKIASQDITVEGANVTIKNGTIETSSDKQLKVDSSKKVSTLTIADDVTVNSTSTSNAVIQVSDSTNNTEVNVNGTWTVQAELVDCDDGKNLTVNLNAKVTGDLTSKTALITLDGGTSIVNVNGGSYSSNKGVFVLEKGTLNVTNGNITAEGNHAIIVKSTKDDASTLNIAGGNITATGQDKYALYFAGSAGNEKGTYSITDGTFTSGKDAEGNKLTAIKIDSKVFLENHPGMITGGTFVGGIVGDTPSGDRTTYAAVASKQLVAEGIAMVTENGQVVVGTTNGNQSEQTEEPTAPESQEATGNTADAKNPGTSDNFMSLVSLVSASAAGLFMVLMLYHLNLMHYSKLNYHFHLRLLLQFCH